MNETDRTVSEDELSAYVDGALDAERMAAIESHLADNEAARERVATWRRQRELVKAALDPVAEEAVPQHLKRSLQRRVWRRHVWPSAIAATLAFTVGLGTGWAVFDRAVIVSGRPDTIAETGLSAYRVYVSEVRHPVEVAADEETHLVNWLSKRLATPIKAPDLSGAGLKLLGGRLVPANDQPGAMLMYEGADGERFTLFIAREPEGKTTAFRYAESGQIGAFYWIDRTVGYALSGPDDRERLLRVARAVYDQLS